MGTSPKMGRKHIQRINNNWIWHCCGAFQGFSPAALTAFPLAALGGCRGSEQAAQCPGAVAVQKRIDCHPQPGASQEACEARGCVWCSAGASNAPWCFFPEDSPYGYARSGSAQQTDKGWRVTLNKRQALSLFGNDISPIVLEVEFQTKDRLRFRLYDPNKQRFEVPLKIDGPGVTAEEANYEVESQLILSPSVCHRWDSPLVDLFFSNQFLEITTTVPSTSVYGFGEHEHPTFKHNMDFVTYGMYARDQAPTSFANLYGVHPFYMCVEPDSNAHGVLLLNSNAQDVTLSPNPSLTFRTIGGILDFYLFMGPTPENVVQQYTEAIGRPHMPAYWSLGFQLSRWGYNSLDVLKATVDRMKHYDIPYDVQHYDIDYMERRLDFTYDKVNFAGLPEFMKELKKNGKHNVVILDPFVTKDEEPGTYRPYELGQEMGVWVNNSDGVTPAVGQAWPPGYSVFPDFTNPRTVEWWTTLCLEFKDVLDYDGIWIDMNEPSNFMRGQIPGCADTEINNPPYTPTVFVTILVFDLVAFLCSVVQQATGKRAFVLSRSTFVGSGKHGAHWLGDNFSLWKDLRRSIIGILEFNLFGIPYIGADICGFNYNTTYELCLRWMQLGSFYPFSRNHNSEGNIEQDPAVFGDTFAEISRDTLRIRYSLLPYLYTLFYESHVHGGTVGLEVPSAWKKTYTTVSAPLNKIPLYIRGGYILPQQAPATTTTESRLNPFGLIIALDEEGQASGSLFWDDGDSIGKPGPLVCSALTSVQGIMGTSPKMGRKHIQRINSNWIWQCCGAFQGFSPAALTAFPLAALGGCRGSEQAAQCPGAVAVQKRIDCHPQPGASREACEARGCVWCSAGASNAPWCFFPEDSPYGYARSGSAQQTDKGWSQLILSPSVCHRWDSPLVDLFFSNQFLEITTTVPSTSVYGFGEHEHPTFKHNMDFVTYGMYARDQPPTSFANLYGVHPFYMCVEPDSNAHGVLLLNANAQDVTLSPNPSLTFRTIGGILDFYLFMGPTPENVVQQYTEAIGRPHMPAYWSLGFQLSRYGYNSLDALKATDVQHYDIDYMERHLDFTYDKVNFAGLPEFMKELKKNGKHNVVILEPGTYRPYELGQEMGVWVNNSDGVTPALGQIWPPGYSVFPDFTNPRTVEWWTTLCLEFKDVLDYDGIWIDMNEPANFMRGQLPGCADTEINNPPYTPSITDRSLAEKTLCPDSKTYLGDHYNTHSLFGWSQTEPTFNVVQQATGKRAFVLARSTFVGSGKHGGHWLGDNFSLWKDLHHSIIGILEFNLFGIPYVGADICGFNYNTTYELCLRWMQLGSFYPFSRNHNSIENIVSKQSYIKLYAASVQIHALLSTPEKSFKDLLQTERSIRSFLAMKFEGLAAFVIILCLSATVMK
uniref:alpha-glucosidase n=1 Tax=Taeniopygia guttata TaxID=59729 RepID=A0A674G9G1_TAEGU